ncbi:AraC family transcriptional regulator [Alkalibacterium subtropicum]|uniref:AraC family transcriptional regulator n=1 Tax=Alkalibacterium subtropicum TaxID=753702 RepID=A0A1I1KND1_9LACT|nr:AraC family transcriptional regulator [Alkalibacterium subtropicum]SFC62366.1 AraC family transcriptional regulator [Alkalibacterium subtropicum]
MDYFKTIQKAIDYMEDHLLEDISYSDVAKHLYLSNFHFQRTFSLITGVTPNEYIRYRRLSMAGEELTLSRSKVIDVAYKYQYESPESFSKAFTRFHGVSPGKAKKAGIDLNSYNRLVMKLSTEGGTIMNYRIVEKEPFKLIAKVEQFPNESIDDSSEVENKIPDFWKESGRSDVFETLQEHAVTEDLYGVCAPMTKESDYFAYGIGMLHDGRETPDGYRVWHVESTLWAVFPCIGDSPDCIGETWERIFKEFLPGSNYRMLEASDFEFYPAEKDEALFCEIWIPVEKKSES